MLILSFGGKKLVQHFAILLVLEATKHSSIYLRLINGH